MAMILRELGELSPALIDQVAARIRRLFDLEQS
jgi:hypothetical protein